jgi:two-component system alkaline phosphatase synthesis response regulator PhoP
LVEDDRAIAKVLRYALEKEGHTVETAEDGEAGIAAFRRSKPRLLLLDLMLPKIDGLEVCRLIRREDPGIPILMLTAKSTEIDKIVGLEMGADDYVTKPFSVREVVTRVKALLRRASGGDGGRTTRTAGDLEIDTERYELFLKKKPVALTGKEFDMLRVLWDAGGKALTRDALLERVWGLDRSTEIDTRTVDQHVARLRAKLGSERDRLLTVKNVGYRFASS